MRKVLTIAGSDSSGGAGIQADIKTITAHGMYAMSAVTALTAQNTQGVYGILEVAPGFLEQQISCTVEDIFPDAVKIGMVFGGELIRVVAEKIKQHALPNVVVDTVMISSSGHRLMDGEAEAALCQELLPLASLITPNLPEAEALCGIRITTKKEMEEAANRIADRFHCAVLLKGGHLDGDASDLLVQKGRQTWFTEKRLHNPNTHGTGCTLSSAIACGLAGGLGLEESIREAKNYLTGAIAAGLDLGKGSGPMNHMYRIEGKF